MSINRVVNPTTNATGLGAAAAAVYAGAVMIWHATHHQGVIDPQVILAAVSGAWLLYTRFKVTPVADPKDGNGAPLIPVAAVATLKPPLAAGGTASSGTGEGLGGQGGTFGSAPAPGIGSGGASPSAPGPTGAAGSP